MSRRRSHLVGAAAAALCVLALRGAGAAEDPMPDLAVALRESVLEGGYRSATASEAAFTETLFERLLRGERGEGLEAALNEAGFSLDESTQERLLLLQESPDRRTGKGFYALRGAAAASVAIEAPHRFKDLRTGDIAERLMATGAFAAAAWNTAPRWYEARSERVDADLAHAPQSHLSAFTRAFGRVHPDGLVVQLHGFEATKRRTPEGRGTDLIVSPGFRGEAGPLVRARLRCLRRLADWTVRLYPGEVRELGGTTNANAAALRELRAAEFLHLEMAREVRERLAEDDALLRRFSDCLSRGRG